MKVRLIAATKSMIPEADTGGELLAYIARVSNQGNQHNKATAPKLLAHMQKEGHWSPFAMVNVVLEITTTRDIARQVLRHQSMDPQEFSQRYAAVDFMDECVFREARMQDPKNRQSSLECTDSDLKIEWLERQHRLAKQVDEDYKWALENGLAKEVARAILPEGMTPSVMYMNGTIRSWTHYLQARLHDSTQKEHRDVAQACAEVLRAHFPELKGLI